MKKHLCLLIPAIMLFFTGFSQDFKAFHYTPDTTFLPDGNGTSYTTSILVEGYSPGDIINSEFDIISICVDMEHSYLGDLNMSITCPSGQTINMVSYPNGAGATHLGEPIESDGDGPGIGYDYCWTPIPEYGTMSIESNNVTTLLNGSYATDDPLTDLIGCELNGFWTITITDHLSVDDGYIFNWGINLANDPGCFTQIQGNLYVDVNGNNQFDDGEPPIPFQSVIAEPGPHIGYSNAEGHYHIYVDSGSYTVQPNSINPPWLTSNPEFQTVEITTNDYDTIPNIDFSYVAETYCPDLSVDATIVNLAICENTMVYINYSNHGTINAEETEIMVELDENMTYLNGGNLISQDGNILTFDIGNVDIGETGNFIIHTQYSCDPEMAGTTVCVEALITPNDPCEPIDPAWDHSSISVEGFCDGDSLVCFIIENTGEPGEGDMAGPSQYRIFENTDLVEAANFQINGGETLEICWPANGNTITMEADQRPGHPGNSHPQDAIELCGSPNEATAYITSFPLDDLDDFVEVDCQVVLASLDPNDKKVSPQGLTQYHFIDSTQVLEYTVRFQNTGTAPAQTVVIKDNISDLLDISSFEHLGASHNCIIDFPAEKMIRWTFNDIMLPDSSSNPTESIGFVKFKIHQNPGNTFNMEILNKAGIYFDYNLPVITNEVFNKIGKFDPIILSKPTNFITDTDVSIYPNPAVDNVSFLSVENMESIVIYNIHGKEIKRIENINSSTYEMNCTKMKNGLYFYMVKTKSGIISDGKILFNK